MNLKQTKTGNDRSWIKFYTAEIIVALEHLHKSGIVYRDLKPENCVIDKDGHLKIVDFGFAKKLKPGMRAHTNCGTVGYTAPEVLFNGEQGYSFEADVWSFGILLCELIQGFLPFDDKNNNLIIEE